MLKSSYLMAKRCSCGEHNGHAPEYIFIKDSRYFESMCVDPNTGVRHKASHLTSYLERKNKQIQSEITCIHTGLHTLSHKTLLGALYLCTLCKY